MFLVFAGLFYYADGGALDFKGCYSSLGLAIGSARQIVKTNDSEWAHIFDVSKLKIVYQCSSWIPTTNMDSDFTEEFF